MKNDPLLKPARLSLSQVLKYMVRFLAQGVCTGRKNELFKGLRPSEKLAFERGGSELRSNDTALAAIGPQRRWCIRCGGSRLIGNGRGDG